MSLKINDISVQIDSKRVLKNASFEAETGKITGICGWSGSGKTTLLKAIAGLLPIENGTVVLDARGASGPVGRGEVRYVPPIPERSRWKALFTSTSAGPAKQRAEIEAAAKGGEKVILVDEAVSLLDERQRDECFAELRRSLKNGLAVVIYATSNFGEILERCEFAAILDNAEIVQNGVPQEIYETPKTKAVAELTGRINIIEVRRLSSSKADTQEFQTIAGGHRLFAKRAALSSMGALNQNTYLAIRPEQISISFGASFPEDNLLRATVTATHFLGPSTLVSIDCGGLGIEALVPRLVGLNIGDECMVGLPPDRLRILNK